MKKMEPTGFQEKRSTTDDFNEEDATLGLPVLKRTLDYGEEDGNHQTSRRRGLQLTFDEEVGTPEED